MLHDDLFHPVADVTHLLNLVRFELSSPAGRPEVGAGASWFCGRAKTRARETRLTPQFSRVAPAVRLRLSHFKCLDQRGPPSGSPRYQPAHPPPPPPPPPPFPLRHP